MSLIVNIFYYEFDEKITVYINFKPNGNDIK